MNESQLNKIVELEHKKADFLVKNPHMQYIQDKIDVTLEEVGKDPTERCRALNLIMLQSMQELSNSVAELKQFIRKSHIEDMLADLTTTLKELYPKG